MRGNNPNGEVATSRRLPAPNGAPPRTPPAGSAAPKATTPSPPPTPSPAAGSAQHGALEIEGPDHPAGWFADSDGPSGTPGSATPESPTAGSATPAAGSAAAGSAVDPLAPTDDKLPEFGTVTPPVVTEEGPMPRKEKFINLGGKDMVRAVFDELSPGNLGKRVYFNSEDNSYVLIQLKTRVNPEKADFDKAADSVIAELRKRRAEAAVYDFVKTRCEAMARASKIKPSIDLVTERDGSGNLMPVSYRPCMSFLAAPQGAPERQRAPRPELQASARDDKLSAGCSP